MIINDSFIKLKEEDRKRLKEFFQDNTTFIENNSFVEYENIRQFGDLYETFLDENGLRENDILSLFLHAECVVTNSFHGMIFATQYRIPYYGFSRDQCDTKISELMQLFGLKDRIIASDDFKTSCFEDIVAGISLYRPGPIDQIPRYIKNKNNPDDIQYDKAGQRRA